MARLFADLSTLKKCYVLTAIACLPGVVLLVIALNVKYGDGSWMPAPNTPGAFSIMLLSGVQLLAIFVAAVVNLISALRFVFAKTWRPIFNIVLLYVALVLSLVPWGMIGESM